MSEYTPEIMDRIVEYARKAGRAAQAGESGITLGEGSTAQRLSFRPGGMCQRFVRQIVETACGFKPFSWRYATARAKYTLAAMDASNLRMIVQGQPGDIVGHRIGDFGHIGIYVGEIDGVATIAENTSSGRRGNPRRPGTKLTPLADFTGTEWYRLPMAPMKQETVRVKVVELGGHSPIVLAEYEMHPDGNHIADQGKLYVLKQD